MKGCDSSCQEPHHKRSLSRNPSCRHHLYYHSYRCSHPSANYMPPSGSQYTDRFCKDTVFMLEYSIIAYILSFIIFFIIGIKCTFPARHQKRKSPDRRPGGTPSGGGGSNPAGRPKILFYSDLAKFSLYHFAKSQFFNIDLAE